MQNCHLRTFGMVAALPLLSFAAAQAAGQTPPPVGPAEVGAFVKPSPSVTGPHSGGGRLKSGVKGTANAPLALGWNFVTGSASWVQTPDNINFYLYCYNTDGSFFYYFVNSPLLSSPKINCSRGASVQEVTTCMSRISLRVHTTSFTSVNRSTLL
jgi:hypothetical protein